MSPAKKKRKLSPKKTASAPRRKGGKGPDLKIETPAPAPERKSLWAVYSLLGSLALAVAGLFSLPNYHILLTPGGILDHWLVHPSLLLVGFIGLFLLFRTFPDFSDQPEDIPLGWVYIWFSLFSGLCFFSRFYHPEEAPPYFFVDQLMVTGDIRSAMDFHQYSLIFPYGSPQPFARYLTVVLWDIFPKASGLWITRLSSTFIDIGVLWSLYVLGRGINGRRTGLIMMSFWALSMPGTIWAYSGYGASSVILACALTLLVFCQLVQKPSMANFIIWGILLAFGDYTYAPFRLWTPTLITLILLWIYSNPKERPKGGAPLLLSVGIWIFWLYLFVYTNKFLPPGPWTSLLVKPWFLGAALIVLLAAYLKSMSKIGESEGNRKIFGWATGVLVTGILMWPLMFHPLYSDYMANRSVFLLGDNSSKLLSVFKEIWPNVTYAFHVIFSTSEPDFSRYPIPGHSFFEVFPQMAMVVGLAYFLAIPSWRKNFLILMILVGTLPFILSQRPHTGRLFGAVAPLFLMGAWGLDAFWGIFTREMKNGVWRTAALLLLFGFWAWDAKTGIVLGRGWMTYRTTNDAVIGAQLEKDWKQYRVILARHDSNFFQPQFTMLCDQRDAWLLNDPNPIYLGPGEKSKDIVLYVYGGDEPTAKRVREEFPMAQWTDVPSLNGPNFLHRIFIPFDSLGEVPGKLLYVQRIPREYWRRRFYWADYPYGIARGMVWWEDSVPAFNAAFPPGIDAHVSAEADGELMVRVDGEYCFSASQTLDVIFLSIDGKNILNQRGGLPAKAKVFLKAGDHPVVYKTAFRSRYNFTDILVTPPNGDKEWNLGTAR